jgi:hypothetical protein
MKSKFRIEHSTYISVGGAKASVWACPSPQQYHEYLWDPEFGGGGTLVGVKNISINQDTARSKTTSYSRYRYRPTFKAPRRKKRGENADQEDSTPADPGTQGAAYHNSKNGRKHTKRRNISRSSIGIVDLPMGARVPNGIFARKHRIVPSGDALPFNLLKVLRQPTVDEIVNQKSKQHLNNAIDILYKLNDRTESIEDSTKLLEGNAVKSYLTTPKRLSDPIIFFDRGLDEDLDDKWSSKSSNYEPQEPLTDLEYLGSVIPVGNGRPPLRLLTAFLPESDVFLSTTCNQ